jgi:heptosyltransferase-2
MVTEPKRILVRGVSTLGEAIMSTPALIRLRERFPEAEIRLLAPDHLGDLWHFHPALDSAFEFRADESAWSIGRGLREHRFDLAVIFSDEWRAGLECRLAGIPQRIGYSVRWRNALLTRCIPRRAEEVRMRRRTPQEVRALIKRGQIRAGTFAPAIAHRIHHYLHLTAQLGADPDPVAPRLTITESEVERVRIKFGLDLRDRLIALNTGGEKGPATRWPAEHVIAAALAVRQRTRCTWLLMGGGGDAPLAGRIETALHRASAPVRNLTGQTSLRELCAILQSSRALLTNDSGTMHVAAAVGTPVVAPFGGTSRELAGPGLPGDTRHQVITSAAPCAPCFMVDCPIDLRCMENITVDRVTDAVVRASGLS